MKITNIVKSVAACAAATFGFAHAAVIIPAGDTAYVNQSIGNLLDGTSAAFPTASDPSQTFGPTQAPDLSAAASVLGGWLGTPPDFSTGTGWSMGEVAVPTFWTVGTEIALVYEFTTAMNYVNVMASIGVDNGVFVWLDGNFIGGRMDPGGAPAGEYQFDLGSLSIGTHYLAILLEDHGGATGFNLAVNGDVDMNPIPVPMGAVLFATGLAFFGLRRRG